MIVTCSFIIMKRKIRTNIYLACYLSLMNYCVDLIQLILAERNNCFTNIQYPIWKK